MYALSTTQLRGSQSVSVITTCPHCSILRDNTCEVCEPGDENHPSCRYCENGLYKPPAEPWYRSELVLAIGTAVIVSVASALIITAIQAQLKTKD